VNFSPDTIIDEIIRLEGGYTDDPKDSGGETNHGIETLPSIRKLIDWATITITPATLCSNDHKENRHKINKIDGAI